MIRTREDFEAALEEAAQYLECPPAHGTHEAAEFAALLREIERYKPDPTPAEEVHDPLSIQMAQLEKRLAKFREMYLTEAPHAFSEGFGFGH
jgi:hypothetical protein